MVPEMLVKFLNFIHYTITWMLIVEYFSVIKVTCFEIILSSFLSNIKHDVSI